MIMLMYKNGPRYVGNVSPTTSRPKNEFEFAGNPRKRSRMKKGKKLNGKTGRNNWLVLFVLTDCRPPGSQSFSSPC